MKFFNKLSVISLMVLMFSFMNVANALPTCVGDGTNSCSAQKSKDLCESHHYVDSSRYTQCKWLPPKPNSFVKEGKCTDGDACTIQPRTIGAMCNYHDDCDSGNCKYLNVKHSEAKTCQPYGQF